MRTSRSRCIASGDDHRGRYALPPEVRIDRGIEDEGVYAAVPGDIDKADETSAIQRANVNQAASQDGPEAVGTGTAPGALHKRAQLFVRGIWIDDDIGHVDRLLRLVAGPPHAASPAPASAPVLPRTR